LILIATPLIARHAGYAATPCHAIRFHRLIFPLPRRALIYIATRTPAYAIRALRVYVAAAAIHSLRDMMICRVTCGADSDARALILRYDIFHTPRDIRHAAATPVYQRATVADTRHHRHPRCFHRSVASDMMYVYAMLMLLLPFFALLRRRLRRCRLRCRRLRHAASYAAAAALIFLMLPRRQRHSYAAATIYAAAMPLRAIISLLRDVPPRLRYAADFRCYACRYAIADCGSAALTRCCHASAVADTDIWILFFIIRRFDIIAPAYIATRAAQLRITIRYHAAAACLPP